jgi:hypothetical protein
LQNTADGTAVYVETQTPTTNANGLLSIYIGAGTPLGSEVFSDINWSTGSYFIKIEIDTSGDNGSYDITGTTQLVSVPYALYAKTAGSSTDGWKLTGNANTDDETNFIGTTDDIPFNIRVNNIPAGRIDSNGNTSLGYDTFTIDGVAIGNESDGVFGSVAIGNASIGVFGSVAIGNASIGVEESVTIGNGSYSEFEGITIGNYSYNEGLNSIVIGNKIEIYEDNIIQLGNNEVTAVQLGTGTNVTLKTGLVKITGGSPSVGKVLTSDAAGLASWAIPAVVSVNKIIDADANTKIQVEKNANEDIIRFDLAGTEKWVMQGSRLEPKNTGNSVFIGEGAGAVDDLTANRNVFIGDRAGISNTSGALNVANGSGALSSNTTGVQNVANGAGSLAGNTEGYYNSAYGVNSLFSNTTGYSNSVLGTSAGSSNTTGYNNTFVGFSANVSTGDLDNVTAIGNGAIVNASNKVQIGNNLIDAVQLGTGANVTLETGLVKITGGTPGVGKVLTSDADGLAGWEAGAANVREIADEFSATANQTTFTLTQMPSTNSKVKMYVNGIRISNTAYTYTSTGTSLTYDSANNGGYVLTVSDRIQFDYFY